MDERWLPISYALGYEVSDAGRVRRTLPGRKTYPGKVLRLKFHHHGYPRVGLTINGLKVNFEVHRLVADAFHAGSKFDGAEVAHNDGNPKNAHASNLRWATHADNEADKRRHGTTAAGERNGAAKLTAADVALIRDPARSGSANEAAAKFGISWGTVYRLRRGQGWRHAA